MSYDVFVFDWDGTLVDSMKFKINNLAILLNDEYKADRNDVRMSYEAHSGIPRKQLFKKIINEVANFDISESDFNRLSIKFTDMNRETYLKNGLKLFPDAEVMLEKLREKINVKIYISSSASQEELDAAVKSAAYMYRFNGMFGSKEGFSKGIEHISRIKKLEQCNSDQILFVGDDKNDVRLGQQAGVDTKRILRKTDAKDSSKFLGTLSELLQYT
ncbi:MAG: HAD family hydrolase [Oligoflexales bacterium]